MAFTEFSTFKFEDITDIKNKLDSLYLQIEKKSSNDIIKKIIEKLKNPEYEFFTAAMMDEKGNHQPCPKIIEAITEKLSTADENSKKIF